MKEWIVNLYAIKGRIAPTKTRVFAANQAAAIQIAKQMNPGYKTGAVVLANN